MPHAGDADATHYVRRFLTALLAIPMATEGTEKDDSHGTHTLWFHENKDKGGNPSNNIYGVSNCHVLRKDTTVEYVLRGGAAKDHVRVCGMRRFQRGLDEIMSAIAAHVVLADYYVRQIVTLEAQNPQNPREIRWNRRKLEEENEAIDDLETLHDDVTKHWSNIKQRNIGHVVYAPAITVDKGRTGYTADWGVFLATEANVKDAFEGNVVDLGAIRFYLSQFASDDFNPYSGSKYTPLQLTEMFYPLGGPTTFKYPEGRRLRIFGCATKEELAVPAEFDSEGQHCLIVGKDGNTTDLTVGRYGGLESFTFNASGDVSKELAIYNSGHKTTDAFAAKGDSGSLVWHMKDGQARIVSQLHSGQNKGASTSNHVTYCTPGWYLLDEIKKKFKYADFYRTKWAA